MLISIALCSDLMTPAHPMYYGRWMHFDYLRSVESLPGVNPTAPFCWRLLEPVIVYLLPFSIQTGYFIVTYLSILISALLVYLITRNLFTEKYYPWISVLTFFSLINVVRINAIEFIAVDPPAFMFMLLAVYSIYRKNNILFVISTILGVLTKETVLIVLPLYFTINYKTLQNNLSQNKKDTYLILLRTALLSLPAIAVFVLLRLLITPQESYNYFDLIYNITKFRLDTLSGNVSTLNINLFEHQSRVVNSLINIYRITFGAVGPILFFIILKAGRIRKEIFRLSPLLILSFLQIFIAGDNERIVAAGFPAYILLFLFSIRSFIEDDKIDIRYFLYYAGANFIVQLFLTKNYYWQTYFSVVVQLILGMVMVAAIYAALKRMKVE